MNPRELIDSKVAPCIGQNPHVWQRIMLAGCSACEAHVGFECVLCRRCVDWELDTPLYEAILSLFPEEDIDD